MMIDKDYSLKKSFINKNTTKVAIIPKTKKIRKILRQTTFRPFHKTEKEGIIIV